ncbi:hypothetical protein BU16DRAFT_567652 [Lophium mytilinum]|uniref:4'-phosphopantetheinyl transferase domain-containing protein n=1 Tax=Lophium mytilinum TaxID=390894 RepID=A0A6A6QBV2_9PEZI|nr:hypothetical protein BU16DRAFT_567652 [Lophium mytilinum]
MAPRPFALPYNVGIDICHVPRIVRFLITPSLPSSITASQRPGRITKLLDRIYHPLEQRYYWARFGGDGVSIDIISKHIAGRWAAKEAVIKAVKPRRILLRDVVVLSHPRDSSDPSSGGVYAVVLDRPFDTKATPKPTPVTKHKPLKFFDKNKPKLQALQAEDIAKSVQGLEGEIVNLSISHDGDYACAVCIAPTMHATPTSE